MKSLDFDAPATMRILLIKLKNIGDTLLMTPSLSALKKAYPTCRISVLVRRGTEGILEGCPFIDEILLTAEPEKNKRSRGIGSDMRLLFNIRSKRFDWVFDFSDNDRGRLFACLSGGRNRIVTRFEPQRRLKTIFSFLSTGRSDRNWQLIHRAEKDHHLVSEFLPLDQDVPPLVFVPPEGRDELIPEGRDYVVVHPVSRWRRKAWPAERWVEICRHLTQRGLLCVLSSGPDEAEVAYVREICEKAGPDVVSTLGKRSWATLGRLIQHARLFVGLDTAAMHLAAACQRPIVALFGPSIEHHWRPWKCPQELIHPGEPLHSRFPEFLTDAESRSMMDITTEQVTAACDRLLLPSTSQFKNAAQ